MRVDQTVQTERYTSVPDNAARFKFKPNIYMKKLPNNAGKGEQQNRNSLRFKCVTYGDFD